MTRPRFDLTREPWIACETLTGARVELGFEEVLLRAHELAGVRDESPLATAMLHRLLLAILHRVVDGPHSLGEWAALWRAARIDPGPVHAYLDRWRHRFDLFDAERPFMQVPKLAEILLAERQKEPERIPASRLALERSFYAGSVNLLEHGGDGVPLTPAEGACAMLGFLGFGPGGRILNDSGYPKGCPLRTGAVVLARGETLHRTLLLNLLVLDQDRPIPGSDEDAPAWEQAKPTQRAKRAVRGWLDALTWQPRRVELLPDSDGDRLVVTCAVTGAGLEPEGAWAEPMQALLVRDVKRGPEPVRFDPDRSPWRDATALFQAAGGDAGHRRPAVCTQIAQLAEEDILGRSRLFALNLYGLASSQAAIGLWRAERMPLPLRLLTDPDRLDVLRTALAAAEAAEDALRKSVWRLASTALAAADRNPDKKDVGALASRLGAPTRFWAALGARFDEFLRAVGTAVDAEPLVDPWKASARDAARKALDQAAQQIGTHARALQARALAERLLARELATPSPAPVPVPLQEGALP